MPTMIITTPATVRGLVSLAVVKEELGITGTVQDGLLRRRIQEESERIADFCQLAPDQLGRRTFAAELAEVSFSPHEGAGAGHGSAPLFLPWRFPVVVSSVVEDGLTLNRGEYVVAPMAALLYRMDPGSGRHLSWAEAPITITCTMGWDLATEAHPAPLRRACIELIRARHAAATRDPAIKSESVDGVMRTEYWVGPVSTLVGGIPAEVAALLEPYTNMSLI